MTNKNQWNYNLKKNFRFWSPYKIWYQVMSCNLSFIFYRPIICNITIFIAQSDNSYHSVLDFAVSEANNITYYFKKRSRLLNFSLEITCHQTNRHWILRSQHLGGKSLIGCLKILHLIWSLSECYGIANKNTPPKASNFY